MTEPTLTRVLFSCKCNSCLEQSRSVLVYNNVLCNAAIASVFDSLGCIPCFSSTPGSKTFLTMFKQIEARLIEASEKKDFKQKFFSSFHFFLIPDFWFLATKKDKK